MTSQRAAILVALLVALAGALRIPALTRVPPGLNQDEACNAWNAWCLLKTGRDQTGTSWPLFYLHAFGENRSALYAYLTIPFQLAGGLNIWTTRLPNAVLGVLTVPLFYFVARRLFDRGTGLVAATLLALAPWHIQLSRTGHEAGVVPLLVILPLAALLWAGFPLTDRPTEPRAGRALVAGLACGLCCYGYPAVLLVNPPLLLAWALCMGRAWTRLLKNRATRVAVATFAFGYACTFGPLLYQYLARPHVIGKRAVGNWVWEDNDGLAARLGKVAQRYATHFGPDFLFISGDHHETQYTPGFGAFEWYVLPLLLTGLLYTAKRVQKSAAARVALCWLALTPLGDSFHRGYIYEEPQGRPRASMHALRAAPFLAPPLLLAAVGARAAHDRLWRRRRAATIVYAVLGMSVVVLEARFLRYYFRDYHRRPLVYESYQADWVDACHWLRPRMGDLEAVFINARDMNTPYVIALVVLRYDPAQWFSEPRELRVIDTWETYTRVGKLYFLHEPGDLSVVEAFRRNGRPDRVIFVVRPGELRGARPAHVVHAPDGTPFFEIIEETW